MENAISFSFTLLGLKLAEIGGVKVGSMIRPFLSNLLYRVQYYEVSSNFKSFYVCTFTFNGKYRGKRTLP